MSLGRDFFSGEIKNEDIKYDLHLRPNELGDFIGQKNIIQNIEVMLESAQKRTASVDHMLYFGPPGLGKTSLAYLVANAIGSNLHCIAAPALDKKADLAAILSNLNEKDILFVDEIHRLNNSLEEMLYSAMEDFHLDIIMGQGISARTMRIPLQRFTLIGATTRAGLLSRPLRDRFMGHFHFEYYKVDEIKQILLKNAKKMNLLIEGHALMALAACSRGTPRIGNRILLRIRDYSIVKGLNKISDKEIRSILAFLSIDYMGLDEMDRKIMKTIHEQYNNGPVGIETLCATLNEDRETIEDIYEPHLLQNGFLVRTSRGRSLTLKGQDYLKGNSAQ